MRTLSFLALATCVTLLCSACAPQAYLRYSPIPPEGSDVPGYAFVVPRTVVKVTNSATKPGDPDKFTFTSVPVSYAENGAPLQPYLAIDDSSSGFALTPTTISSVTYADTLIISAIGTAVTDNRKAAIDSIVGIVAAAGGFAAAADCTAPPSPSSFVIESANSMINKVPNNECWAYTLSPSTGQAIDLKAFDINTIPTNTRVAWFPIPVCKSYLISLYRCQANADCTKPAGATTTATVSISDGKQYKKSLIPAKGKISLHTDFCGADFTNDSAGTDSWTLLNQVISDVKTAKSNATPAAKK